MDGVSARGQTPLGRRVRKQTRIGRRVRKQTRIGRRVRKQTRIGRRVRKGDETRNGRACPKGARPQTDICRNANG